MHAGFRSYRRVGTRRRLFGTDSRRTVGILLSPYSFPRRWMASARRTYTHARTHINRQTNRSAHGGATFRRTMLNRAINSIRLAGRQTSAIGRRRAALWLEIYRSALETSAGERRRSGTKTRALQCRTEGDTLMYSPQLFHAQIFYLSETTFVIVFFKFTVSIRVCFSATVGHTSSCWAVILLMCVMRGSIKSATAENRPGKKEEEERQRKKKERNHSCKI